MSIEDLLIKLAPFYCVPICISLLSTIIRIIRDIAQGKIEIGERQTERKENVNDLKKINIDADLQKYFNYKE